MAVQAKHPIRHTPQWTFGDRIRKARLEAGMDQREFAAALAVTASALAQWETGRAVPRDIVAVAKRVELLTGVTAGWLLDLDQPVGSDPTRFNPGVAA